MLSRCLADNSDIADNSELTQQDGRAKKTANLDKRDNKFLRKNFMPNFPFL